MKEAHGVNYRHAFHAGNPADVFKHALLLGLVRAFERKERGFLYVDTHAGRGRYDLSLAGEGDTRARVPEWPSGIGALWDRGDPPPPVLDFLQLVRAYDRSQGNLAEVPRFYPGSPWIVRLARRPQDRLELWERHPADCAALRAGFEGERATSVHEADGYRAFRACLPPRERRALVLVDPPYESPGEWSHVAAGLAAGLERFPTGTYVVWYPLTERADPDGLIDAAAALAAPSFAAELITDPRAPGMRGSGLLVVNPPWKFEAEASVIVDYLETTLATKNGAASSLRWIVSK